MVSLALKFTKGSVLEKEVEELFNRFDNIKDSSDTVFIYDVNDEDNVIDYLKENEKLNLFSYIYIYDKRVDIIKEYKVSSNSLVVGDWIENAGEKSLDEKEYNGVNLDNL